MMRIIHTGDIHLREPNDDRWEALEIVLSTADRVEARCVVICGDLFDKETGVDKLRPDLRELFDSFPGSVLILPGNHDSRRLSSGLYFGKRVEVLAEAGSTKRIDEAVFVALPFDAIREEEVVSRLLSLKPETKGEKANILLFHGELLDAAYMGDEYEEDARGYMPLSLESLKGLGFRYVLAGHFHSRFETFDFGEGWFVYPGSPVSITEKEVGRRKVALIELEEKPQELEIDTFHYAIEEIRLDSFDRPDPLALVEEMIEEAHPRAKLSLVISGHVDLSALGMNEMEFGSALEKIGERSGVKIIPRWLNLERIAGSELFKRFETNVQRVGDGELRKAVERMVIQALAEVLDED